MASANEIRGDLPTELGTTESDRLVAFAMRLEAESPAPEPSFRRDLRARLVPAKRRPARLTAPRSGRLLAVPYLASGLLLLATAAIGLIDVGPFASS